MAVVVRVEEVHMNAIVISIKQKSIVGVTTEQKSRSGLQFWRG
jgi:hypothetical protein